MAERSQTVDRRKKPRIDCSYPAVVNPAMGDGEDTEDVAEVVNLSATGLQLHSNRTYRTGEELFLRVRLSSKLPEEAPVPEIAMNCTVIWSKSRSNQSCGTGLHIDRYRFL